MDLETGTPFVLTTDGPQPYIEAEDIGLRGHAPEYLASGNLVFTQWDGVMAAVPFDASSLTITGDPVPVLEGVRISSYLGEGQWAVGPDGSLVYAPGHFGLAGRFSFLDLDGTLEELPFEPRVFGAFALAPNGRRIAAQVYPPVGPQEVWVLDLQTGSERRIKSGFTYNSLAWWPDSESVVYLETVSGGTGDERGRLTRHNVLDMTTTEHIPFTAGPEDMSRDGRWLLTTRWDWNDPTPGIWLFDTSDGTAVLVNGERTATVARLSPDWVAWAHTLGDAYQIMVAPLREGDVGGERLVGQGFAPAWTRGGTRLHWVTYPAPVQLMVAEPPDFSPRVIRVMERFLNVSGRDMDVAPDGRVLYVVAPEQPPINQLVLITNWTDRLPRP